MTKHYIGKGTEIAREVDIKVQILIPLPGAKWFSFFVSKQTKGSTLETHSGWDSNSARVLRSLVLNESFDTRKFLLMLREPRAKPKCRTLLMYIQKKLSKVSKKETMAKPPT